MNPTFTTEKNIQMLISLLKKHGINKIVASPGMTNSSFVASVQNDDFFSVFSCVDERSAAYMACGMAAETLEPVVISCTGATASRNYYPALTEAYYRQLPILAVTSSQPSIRVGQNIPQITDRSHVPPDVVKYSVELPVIRTEEDHWYCNLKANEAILELKHHGHGPVHINLITTYNQDFSANEIPDEKAIHRVCNNRDFPELNEKRIAIFVGAHCKWEKSLTEAVDEFCEKYNAVVICDSTSNYQGKFGVFGNILTNQHDAKYGCCSMNLLIHIGAVSGSYMNLKPEQVWRVNPDGKLVDSFKRLTCVFEMDELMFFRHYNQIERNNKDTSYYEEWNNKSRKLRNGISELPFSGLWIATELQKNIPDGSRFHMGILNSLRCQNYAGVPDHVYGFCNVGGFGIDGCISSMIGSAIVKPDIIHVAVVGDLAFFYDLNVLGNRNIKGNIRILVVNNGRGFEFRKYDCYPVAIGLDNKIDQFIAAAGHNKSDKNHAIKCIAEAFGFDYYKASSREEFSKILPILANSSIGNKPVLVEAITDVTKENAAQYSIEHLETDVTGQVKKAVKQLIGIEKVKQIKKILK